MLEVIHTQGTWQHEHKLTDSLKRQSVGKWGGRGFKHHLIEEIIKKEKESVLSTATRAVSNSSLAIWDS